MKLNILLHISQTLLSSNLTNELLIQERQIYFVQIKFVLAAKSTLIFHFIYFKSKGINAKYTLDLLKTCWVLKRTF